LPACPRAFPASPRAFPASPRAFPAPPRAFPASRVRQIVAGVDEARRAGILVDDARIEAPNPHVDGAYVGSVT